VEYGHAPLKRNLTIDEVGNSGSVSPIRFEFCCDWRDTLCRMWIYYLWGFQGQGLTILDGGKGERA